MGPNDALSDSPHPALVDRPAIHYEILAQRRAGAPFLLEGACENRAQAIELAEDILADKRAIAVRVSKEVMDPGTGEFSSVVVFQAGEPQTRRARKPAKGEARATSPCTSPQDLYELHARETIGRAMEDWLGRNRVTVFELLHRPDLLEQLDASGVELQHGMQRVAVPEAQATGRSVHEIIRGYQGLVDRAIARVLKDGRAGAFPPLTPVNAAEVVATAMARPETAYRLGGSVAASLAPAAGWRGKLDVLLSLSETAFALGEAGGPLLSVVQTPLAEMLESRVSLRDLLGVDGDFGEDLAALTRLVAAAEVDALARRDPRSAALMPPLEGATQRLSRFFDAGAFSAARRATGRRIVRELTGPRRLRPADPAGEIDILRALASALAAAGDGLVDPEDIRRAFVSRSQALLDPAFVSALLATRDSVLAEAEALVWLAENVAGVVNKRSAAKLLLSTLGAHRLETELAGGGETSAARLATLARMQRDGAAVGFAPEDAKAVQLRLGALGGAVEARVKLIAALVRADAEPAHKLFLLTKLASGESAPIGPVTERARAEAFRLMRSEAARDQLATSPELRERLAALMPVAA